MQRWIVCMVAAVVVGGVGLVRAQADGPTAPVPETGSGTVAERVTRPGYERDCGRGRGCVFGQAWSDDVDVTFGHNGCDTRNDVLRDRASEVVIKAGTRGCVVASGTVVDFYTGHLMSFVRGDADGPQIDHVVPLAAAWDLGAADWPLAKRTDFANDPENLVVTSRSVNAGKGDRTPGEWLPASLAGACRYVARYRAVAELYGVAMTEQDTRAIAQVLQRCAGGELKGAR